MKLIDGWPSKQSKQTERKQQTSRQKAPRGEAHGEASNCDLIAYLHLEKDNIIDGLVDSDWYGSTRIDTEFCHPPSKGCKAAPPPLPSWTDANHHVLRRLTHFLLILYPLQTNLYPKITSNFIAQKYLEIGRDFFYSRAHLVDNIHPPLKENFYPPH